MPSTASQKFPVLSTSGDVNRAATDTGSAAGQVHGSARELLEESNHLSGEVEKFLTSVRTT
jgi:methyl-accepting chemotaxis protein